jgi:hypothetical protein
VPNPAVALAVMCVNVGASRSKGVASAQKVAAPVRKRDVPALHMLAGACSAESHESSPHNQAPRDSLPETMSRLKPEAVLRSGLEALLQITPAAGVCGASI